MSHGTVASGWCPVDDRVYEAADGVCPDCGTALVATASAAGSDTPSPERPASSSPLIRAGIIAAIIGAFVLGLSLQSGRDTTPKDETTTPAPAAQDVSVGRVARSGRADLTLIRLIQENDTFTATFATGRGFPKPQLVQGVSVEVSTQHEDLSEVFGVSDVEVTRLDSGFILRGHLEPGSARIAELQLSSIQIAVPDSPEWRVDMGGIWPVRGAEPAVLHVGGSRPAGDGSIRLVSIVSWRDRLEVAFELRGLRAGDTGKFGINEIEIDPLSGAAGVFSATVQEQISPSVIVARFEGVPPNVGSVAIRASRLSRYLAGPWTWRIP